MNTETSKQTSFYFWAETFARKKNREIFGINFCEWQFLLSAFLWEKTFANGKIREENPSN